MHNWYWPMCPIVDSKIVFYHYSSESLFEYTQYFHRTSFTTDKQETYYNNTNINIWCQVHIKEHFWKKPKLIYFYWIFANNILNQMILLHWKDQYGMPFIKKSFISFSILITMDRFFDIVMSLFKWLQFCFYLKRNRLDHC